MIHLRAQDIIDPETEAHYSFKTIRPLEDSHGRISTILHDHDFFELFLIRHGRIRHRVNHAEHLLTAGALVFIRPADRHSFHPVETDDCGLINLAFPAQTVTALFDYLGAGFRPERLLEPELPPAVQLDNARRASVVTQLTRLHRIPHTQKQAVRTQLRLLLANLLGDCFAGAHTGAGAGRNWLQDVCAQMQEPANLRGGVPQMQALAHASPEHLSRSVRKALGCTPTRYVNNLRLAYAANLLLHTDLPIVDICYEVGLDNLSYFYRIFKQQFGAPPARFRNQKRKRPIP